MLEIDYVALFGFFLSIAVSILLFAWIIHVLTKGKKNSNQNSSYHSSGNDNWSSYESSQSDSGNSDGGGSDGGGGGD